MRNFLHAISSVILLIVLGLGPEAQAAKVVGQVVKVDGHAFLIRSGSVVEISKGTYIQDFDEILTEDNAEIMLGDFSRRQLTMAGGGHIKWMNKLIELKRGYVWVQSLNPAEIFVIQTANTQSTISSGELVVSFDVSNLKSQVFALGGKALVKSLLAGAEYELKQGEFSIVHKDFEHGQPRVPTPVGMESMKKMKQLFTLAKPLGRYDDKTFLENQDKASRSLASQDDIQYEVPAAVNPKNFETPPVVAPKTKHHSDQHPVVAPVVIESHHQGHEVNPVKAQHKAIEAVENNVKENKTAGAPVPGEIQVIRKEVLPEKQPDAFKLEAHYNKELKEIKIEKDLRQKKNRPKPIPIKLRVFGQSAASDLRGPASVDSLHPSRASDPLLIKLKNQLKLSDERKNLINKLQGVQSSPGASEE